MEVNVFESFSCGRVDGKNDLYTLGVDGYLFKYRIINIQFLENIRIHVDRALDAPNVRSSRHTGSSV